VKLLKEPLLHFVAGGAVLFGAYALLDRDAANVDAKEPIRITEGDVQWLVDSWSKQWLRAPNPEEVERMVVDLVEEELLAREAVETGLDKGDTVVRRRLAQKLKFLVEDTSRLLEPTEAELASYHAAHARRFEAGPTVSFMQVFFNPEQRADAAADAKTSLVALQRDGGESIAGTMGDRFLIESRFDDLDRTAVSGIFGPEFADAVFALRRGEWSGPIKSGYGLHLVYMSSIAPARPQSFSEVRDAVLQDWRREKEEAAYREYLNALRAKYGVEIDDGVRAVFRVEVATDAATTP